MDKWTDNNDKRPINNLKLMFFKLPIWKFKQNPNVKKHWENDRNGSKWIDVIRPFINKKSSYENIIQSAIAQGLFGLNDELAFDVLYELALPNVKQAYIYEALDALNQIQQIDLNREEKKINLLKLKTDDPDLSIKALVYKALSEYTSEKNWLDEKINGLDEWDAQWIKEIISKQPIVNE